MGISVDGLRLVSRAPRPSDPAPAVEGCVRGGGASGEDGRAMPRLLIVHHTPSPSLHAMLDAVQRGATDDAIEGVEVVTRPALGATASDVLEADGYVLGTPANIGYMSGALKHFFDQIYYPCLDATVRRPYGLYVHGNEDPTGAVRAVEAITGALGWRAVRPAAVVHSEPSPEDLDACWELGATVAATLAEDLG